MLLLVAAHEQFCNWGFEFCFKEATRAIPSRRKLHDVVGRGLRKKVEAMKLEEDEEPGTRLSFQDILENSANYFVGPLCIIIFRRNKFFERKIFISVVDVFSFPWNCQWRADFIAEPFVPWSLQMRGLHRGKEVGSWRIGILLLTIFF